ncbi:dATP/dGTP diphosphohydrolase domain-containing protein [Methylorubrum suomiense]|uniref:dATP/dGTP diphosphohydrolase N-terminal domain-containing protein n=1 Tax=Methylorubrum suomiense TaxID=144191 RepID=A0ABQ4V0J2_9HYPH|nr:dATP/dGTP diphosphohydrolase domain-containing protein [Methylorubrum suomiense]GJE78116.1 hypothetical protein BGCPKDLD_4727 [Methylorubrum suomiense]
MSENWVVNERPPKVEPEPGEALPAADGTERTEAPAVGLRFNSGKIRLSLVPSSLNRYAAYGLMYGAAKYDEHNWRKGFKWTEVYESMQRHLDAFREGEDLDDESGLPHLALAACNLSFLIEFYDKGSGKDDRFRYPWQVSGQQAPGRQLTFNQPPRKS